MGSHKRSYNEKIKQLPFFEKHLGTYTIPPFDGVKSKKFNLYKHKGYYVVTNHYDDEFVNQKTYKNLNELKKDFSKGLKEFD